MPDNVDSSSQPCQCLSWVGGLLGVVGVGTGIFHCTSIYYHSTGIHNKVTINITLLLNESLYYYNALFVMQSK